MDIYLVSTATNNCDFGHRAYANFDDSLKYIHNKLKELILEYADECDFFDRDYVQKFFTEEYFKQFTNVNCRSQFGEFIIRRIEDKKYQFVFSPSLMLIKSEQPYGQFAVCELEILELL